LILLNWLADKTAKLGGKIMKVYQVVITAHLESGKKELFEGFYSSKEKAIEGAIFWNGVYAALGQQIEKTIKEESAKLKRDGIECCLLMSYCCWNIELSHILNHTWIHVRKVK